MRKDQFFILHYSLSNYSVAEKRYKIPRTKIIRVKLNSNIYIVIYPLRKISKIFGFVLGHLVNFIYPRKINQRTFMKWKTTFYCKKEIQSTDQKDFEEAKSEALLNISATIQQWVLLQRKGMKDSHRFFDYLDTAGNSFNYSKMNSFYRFTEK